MLAKQAREKLRENAWTTLFDLGVFDKVDKCNTQLRCDMIIQDNEFNIDIRALQVALLSLGYDCKKKVDNSMGLNRVYLEVSW